MFTHNLITAIRQLLKYKTQSFVSIIGLSAGMICFSLCMYCYRFVTDIDKCFDNHNSLIEFTMFDTNNKGKIFAGTHATLAEELRNLNLPEVETTCCVCYAQNYSFELETEEGNKLPYSLRGMETDSSYSTLFTPVLLQGNWQTATKMQNTIILTQPAARKLFGENANPIGKHLTLISNGDETNQPHNKIYTIMGIMKELPGNNSFNFMRSSFEILLLNDTNGLLQDSKNINITGSYTFGLLHPHRTINDVNQALGNKAFTCRSNFGNMSVQAYPIGKRVYDNSIAPYFAIVTGTIGTLILLVGILNFFYFLTSSFLNRLKEYGIRKICGAQYRQLYIMFVLQTLLIVIFSTLLMYCFIELISPYLHLSLLVFTLNPETSLIIEQATEYVLLIVLLCLAICGSIVKYIRHREQHKNLTDNSSRFQRKRLRNWLLGIQFFICWIFTGLTVAVFLQTEKVTSTLFNTLSSKEKENILLLSLDYPSLSAEQKEIITTHIAQYSGVKDIICLPGQPYTRGFSKSSFLFDKTNKNLDIYIVKAYGNLCRFFNLTVLEGKNATGKKQVLIDSVLARQLGNEVIGTSCTNYSKTEKITICGVVPPMNHQSWNVKYRQGSIFMNLDPATNKTNSINHSYIKCHPGQTKKVMNYILTIMHESLPSSIVPEIKTFKQDLQDSQSLESKLRGIILFFAMVSLIITLMGIYSAITFDATRRQKEVAIRKINGAGFWQIVLLFGKTYGILLVTSALFAFPLIAIILHIWSQIYVFFFNYDILYWSGIFAFITLLTTLTVGFHIWRIARLNPADVIKNE